MNHIAIINKHVRALQATYSNIGSSETKQKARDAVVGMLSSWWGSRETWGAGVVAMQPIPVPVEVSVPTEAVSTPVVAESGCGANTEPVALPVIEGDLPGATGTFYAETVVAPVAQIGGWPVAASMTVIGLAPNRRTVKGRLEDGRVVSLERSGSWKAGDVVGVRLIRAGTFPLFRVG